MTTRNTETEVVTVESALAELREMFPRQDASIEFYTSGQVHIDIWQYREDEESLPTRDNFFDSDTLADCMAQVREWKEESQ